MGRKRPKKKPTQQVNWPQTVADLLVGILGGLILMAIGKILGW